MIISDCSAALRSLTGNERERASERFPLGRTSDYAIVGQVANRAATRTVATLSRRADRIVRNRINLFRRRRAKKGRPDYHFHEIHHPEICRALVVTSREGGDLIGRLKDYRSGHLIELSELHSIKIELIEVSRYSVAKILGITLT